jgi:phage replication O-like protein O
MIGFTKVNNQLFGALLTSKLTKRQLKVLLLVLRFSAGYHKAYAILSKADFEAAGVSAASITDELQKLARLRVIWWVPDRNLIWINMNLEQWAVEKVVYKRGRLVEIAYRNSLDRKLQVTRMGKINVVNSERTNSNNKEQDTEKGKRPFIHTLQQYVRLIAPVSTSEAVILREVVGTYDEETIMAAMRKVAASNDRSFRNFLTVLDQTAGAGQGGKFDQLRARLRKYLDMIPEL